MRVLILICFLLLLTSCAQPIDPDLICEKVREYEHQMRYDNALVHRCEDGTYRMMAITEETGHADYYTKTHSPAGRISWDEDGNLIGSDSCWSGWKPCTRLNCSELICQFSLQMTPVRMEGVINQTLRSPLAISNQGTHARNLSIRLSYMTSRNNVTYSSPIRPTPSLLVPVQKNFSCAWEYHPFLLEPKSTYSTSISCIVRYPGTLRGQITLFDNDAQRIVRSEEFELRGLQG
ncbi:MAG: hypothetical protein ACOCWQ_04985 [Nanoarchaeota archaeon]